MEDNKSSSVDPLLQQLDSDSTDHLIEDAAEKVDLFKISAKTELAKVPKDSVLTIEVSDRDPVNFYCDSEGNFDLITQDEQGNPTRIPIKVIGSSATPDAFYEPDTLTQGGYFQYGIKHQFKSGVEEGVPDKYKLFEDPNKLDPATLQENLNNGTVIKADDGSLFWSVVDQQQPIGPVVSATIMHAQGIDQAL